MHRTQLTSLFAGLVGAALLFPAAAAVAQASDTSDRLERLLQAENLPGVVWSALTPEGPVIGSAGLADIPSDRAMAVETRVHVGSVAKSVLALGVLRLVSEGRVSLDTNVEALLPMLNWRNPWREEAPVTLRHLLEHTAGLDNLRLWQFLNSRVTPDTPLVDAFPVGSRGLLQVRTRPGDQYSYSNMGYALLGIVIEQLTGQRYEDYLDQSLLRPLGMNSSTFAWVSGEDSTLATGYLDAGRPQSPVPMYLRPAGQFTTTAGDMLRLMEFMLGDGRIGDVAFIRPDLLSELGRPTTTVAVRNGLEIGHGLALAGRDRHGVFGYCHPGTTFGFRANLCLFPEQGKAFFYSINADSERADYEAFTRTLIATLELEEEPVVAASAAPAEGAVDLGLYVLSPGNMAQFAWLDWMFGSVWMSRQEDSAGLILSSLQQDARYLLPLGAGLYRDTERRRASHILVAGDRAILSTGLATYRRVPLAPLVLSWVSLLAGVLGLGFVVVRAGYLLVGGRLSGSVLLLPSLGLVAFVLPAVLLSQQHFLAFGEFTMANLSLAVVSGLLPAILVVALYHGFRSGRLPTLDAIALAALLQLCAVLIYQDMLPIVFWR